MVHARLLMMAGVTPVGVHLVQAGKEIIVTYVTTSGQEPAVTRVRHTDLAICADIASLGGLEAVVK